MSTHGAIERVRVHRIPATWRTGEREGEFVATALPRGEQTAFVTARPPESANPDYLLERYGARMPGPLGRPVVQTLPDLLADGVSIVSFPAGRDGALHARIDLVRRAWNLDVAVSARDVHIENADALYSDMLDLLWEVRPEGTP